MPRNPDFVYDEIDERVWREEMDPFLPERIFDFHGHVYLREHKPPPNPDAKPNPSSPKVVDEYPHEVFAEVESRLWPGRTVKAMVFGTVSVGIDFDGINAYASEAVREHGWESLLVPRIDDDAETLLARAREGGTSASSPTGHS